MSKDVTSDLQVYKVLESQEVSGLMKRPLIPRLDTFPVADHRTQKLRYALQKLQNEKPSICIFIIYWYLLLYIHVHTFSWDTVGFDIHRTLSWSLPETGDSPVTGRNWTNATKVCSMEIHRVSRCFNPMEMP